MNKAQEALRFLEEYTPKLEYCSVKQVLGDITGGVFESDPASAFERLAELARSEEPEAKKFIEKVLQFIGGIDPMKLEDKDENK